MKKDTHPKYYPEATVRCSCGEITKTGAAKSEMTVEICSACHPFYTGKEKVIDAAGRVEKFKKRLEKKSSLVKKDSKTASKEASLAPKGRGGKEKKDGGKTTTKKLN